YTQTSQSPWNEISFPINIRPAGFPSLSAVLLKDIIKRIVNEVHPQQIILVGSYAYGTPTADSDLDLLIIMPTSARPAQRSLMISRCLRPRPFPMDILVRTPQEINQALNNDDPFLSKMIKEGKVLYAAG
ncbi:MAG: nucleotidyltransferase domain-containing protein, partial [Anaerolineae bacterium]|nr:nucleotidyltransferase domain-containing protein [Anaerolineae bacterium]